MEANPTFVLVKCDIKNAFNSISRSRILQVLETEESLKRLSWHAAPPIWWYKVARLMTMIT